MSALSIDDLNDDVLGLALLAAGEYKPALVGVCRRWASVTTLLASPSRSGRLAMKTLRLRDLAERGDLSLLVEANALWPFLVEKDRTRCAMARAAARGGKLAVCEALRWAEHPKLAAEVYIGAARRGDEEPMRRALAALDAGMTFALHSWGGKHAGCRHDERHAVFCTAFIGALRGGHERACEQVLTDWQLFSGESRALRIASRASAPSGPCLAQYMRAALAHDERALAGAFVAPMWAFLRLKNICRPANLSLPEAAAKFGFEGVYRASEPHQHAHSLELLLGLSIQGGNASIVRSVLDRGASEALRSVSDRDVREIVADMAKTSNLEVCELARAALGAKFSAWELLRAALPAAREAGSARESGLPYQHTKPVRSRRSAARLAIEWGALAEGKDSLLAGAVGDVTICELLADNGARLDAIVMELLLDNAVFSGNWPTVLFALRHGHGEASLRQKLSRFDDPDTPGFAAIALCLEAGHCARWARYSPDAIIEAACRTRWAKLPKTTGSRVMLNAESELGRENEYNFEVCRVMLLAESKLGRESADRMLGCGHSRHWRQYCGLAVDFGARDFAAMLAAALEAENEEMAALARRWGRL